MNFNFTTFSNSLDDIEKQTLNRFAIGTSKDDCLAQFDFVMSVIANSNIEDNFDVQESTPIFSDNEELLSLIKGIVEKISVLSDKDWDCLLNYLPFDVSVTDDDLTYSTKDIEELIEQGL